MDPKAVWLVVYVWILKLFSSFYLKDNITLLFYVKIFCSAFVIIWFWVLRHHLPFSCSNSCDKMVLPFICPPYLSLSHIYIKIYIGTHISNQNIYIYNQVVPAFLSHRMFSQRDFTSFKTHLFLQASHWHLHVSSLSQVVFVLERWPREPWLSLRNVPCKVFIWKLITISWQPVFMQFSRCLEGLHYFQSRSHADLFMASARPPFTNKNRHRNGPHPGF